MKNRFIRFYALVASVIFFMASELSAQSLGDTVGTTKWVYQTNGSSGSRVALDTEGGVHFTWMKAGGAFPYSQRSVFYNYVDTRGNWLVPGSGQDISQVNGDAFCQICLTPDNRAGVTYHSSNSDFVIYAEDIFPGMGIFSYFDPPDMLGRRCYWPYLAIDVQDNVHIVMREIAPNEGDPSMIGYTRSANRAVWTNLTAVDTILTISQVVAASPVSGKVAIIYSHPVDLANELKNDVYYIESSDGETWNWAHGKINITQYGLNGDSLFAYTDLDAIYDFNDNLHIIWNANWITDSGISATNFLYHYNSQSGSISLMDSVSIELGSCESYPWNRPLNKMTLGVSEESGALFAVYTRFNPGDCSSAGYANGDIFLQYSADNGYSWTEPGNITDTQSPGCLPGQCYSDLWPSIADKVTDFLHIFYEVDRAGGGEWDGENPLLYFKYPTPQVTSNENGKMPSSFNIAQNYPNPFNARTTIEFELAKGSNVNLAVYDISGALVKVLQDGYMAAGKQAIVWDAEEASTGIYFYRLRTAEGSQTRKTALIK